MIHRIVKMTFKPEHTAQFEAIFNANAEKIRHFPGCTHLELLKADHVYFTYSYWEKAADLAAYRQSSLFQEVWSQTKPFFSAPAEAWSTERLF